MSGHAHGTVPSIFELTTHIVAERCDPIAVVLDLVDPRRRGSLRHAPKLPSPEDGPQTAQSGSSERLDLRGTFDPRQPRPGRWETTRHEIG